MSWIKIRNWRKFQHYDPSKRSPVWIKNHLDLLHKDEYLDLTFAQRGLLHSLWLEYARSPEEYLKITAGTSSRLAQKIPQKSLQALVDAGFIEISASKPLASCYHDASPEVEEEKNITQPTQQPLPNNATEPNGLGGLGHKTAEDFQTLEPFSILQALKEQNE